MNEQSESGVPTYVLPEIHFTPDGQHTIEPSDDTDAPDADPPVEVTPPEPHVEAPSPAEPLAEEPLIERHDPFAYMRNAPWMNRKLSPSGRAAILLRRDLEAFPVIEGRAPNHADLDAIVKRTVDYIVPIVRREQVTDMVYDELEKRRADRIAKAQQQAAHNPLPGSYVDASLPAQQSADPVSPNVEIASSDGCAQIIDACQRQCWTLFADKGLEVLPGSGRDSSGRYRRCVRECVAPSGCSY